MKLIETGFPGLLVIEPAVFADSRGYFFESYNEDKLAAGGLNFVFRQDNESCSKRSVLRGLHLQLPPYEQGKLVRVVRGAVRDVAVDLRRSSPTYLKHYSIELSGETKTMFWIPPGFAHGFVTLEDDTVFFYKCTNLYHAPSEVTIRWNDPDLNVVWGIDDPVVSDRDRQAPFFKDFSNPFS